MDRKVLVCQHTTCGKQGSLQVLAAFQATAPAEIAVASSGCLGECGNGPMVVILPSETWYCHVLPDDVPLLVEQHLRRGKVVTAQLYPKFHPPRSFPVFWLAIGSFAMGVLILIIWVGMRAGQSKYF